MKYFDFGSLRMSWVQLVLGLGAVAVAAALPGCSDDDADTTDVAGTGGLSSHAGATAVSPASGGATGGSGSSHVTKGGSSSSATGAGGGIQSGGATATSGGSAAGGQSTNPSGGTSNTNGAGGSADTAISAGASSIGGTSALGGMAGAAGSGVGGGGGVAGSGSAETAGAAGYSGMEFSSDCPGCAVDQGCVGAVVTRGADDRELPWNVEHPLWAEADGIGALRVGIIGPLNDLITIKSIDNADMTPATARFLFELGCVPTGALRINAILDDVDPHSTSIVSSYYLDACLRPRSPSINVNAGLRTVVPLEIQGSCD
ncbi:MAG TPA: hypothetical protein VKP30_09435 [Polyangiaceae bacterium]|nr:hypothetical protein [Polyangiaceae bacterium]